MPNNTFAVNHFPWPDPNFLPCRDPPPVPCVYKLDRNVRRPVYTNFKEPHFSRFFSKCISIIPETWEQICPPFEIKTSKESGMNEIGVARRYFYCSQLRKTLIRTHNWNVRGRAISRGGDGYLHRSMFYYYIHYILPHRVPHPGQGSYHWQVVGGRRRLATIW